MDTANYNASRAAELEDQVNRLDNQLTGLRGRVNECRVRLAEGGKPEAIKSWLDDELKAEDL